ncbi:MAG TPA: ferritin-like domain-containing protein [Bryobacteraceae bacterium]|nr:ferritin-like domain-containing protein [Bryobacteraceae bacterium]
MEQLQELLVDEIRDIYDAEKQLLKALPRLTKAISNPEIKESFTQHLEVTKNQVARVEQCLELLGEKVKSKPCRAMKGLIEEAQEHVQEHEKGEVLDQVLIAAAQKVEHYEIAAYGTARAMAKSLGNKEAMNLLQETLREEEAQDKGLTNIALKLQREIGRAKPQMEEESSGRGGARGGAKKKVAAKGASGNGGGGARSASKRASSSGASKSNGRGGNGNGKSSGSGAGSRVLTDREEIQQWAEERGAHPACVRGTGNKGDIGLLRLDFPGFTGEDKLEEISWDEFFEKFEERELALLVQDKTARGQKSNFNKLVSKETAAEAGSGGGRSRRAGGR